MSLTSHNPSIAHAPRVLPDLDALEPQTGGGETRFDAPRLPHPAASNPSRPQWRSQAAVDQAPEPSVLLATPEARAALHTLVKGGQEPPEAATVANLAQVLENDAEFAELVRQGKDALTGAAPAPTPQVWQRAMQGTWSQGAPGREVAMRNVTAFVFLMMLEAQMEAIKEKRQALQALKMHAGMLDDLNDWLNRVVIPAQRSLNAKIKAGTVKDSLTKRLKMRSSQRDLRVEETIGMPADVDTQWGATDPTTGKIFIPSLAQGAVVPTKVDAQDLAGLITQVDQWRTTLQNHQSKESLDFKRIDDSMSSSWNQLSSFLKSAQEGANTIIRNGLG